MNRKLCVVMVLLFALSIVSCGNAQNGSIYSKGRRCISPWIRFRHGKGDFSINQLKPNADIIASVSICGGSTKKFVDQCHELGIETYWLVGGKENKFDTPEHRKKTIDGYLRECREKGYDGIDLDQEGIEASFRDRYTLFLREASERLHKAGKKLAICVGYMMSTRKTTNKTHMWNFYDPKVIAETCDMVRIMCYDYYSMSGRGVGPISTKPWAKDAMKYWLKYIPREKLIMGLPAYSGDFEMTSDGSRKRVYADNPVVPDGTKIERVWLPYEQINSYRYLDDKGHLHLFFASDAVSTRAHLETVDKLDLAGIGLWHYDSVTAQSWKVIRSWHKERLAYESSEWLVFP